MINIERLKEAKKRMKITYEELSSLSGVPISTIYDLFRGVTTDPRAGTLEAIERALGLSEEGYRDTLPFEVTPMEEELVRTFRTLSEKDKQLFLILMKKIK